MSTNWKKIYSLGSCACAVYSFDTANLYRSSIRRLLWQNKHGDERISKQNHVKRDERESKRATQKVRWFVWGLRSVRKKVSVWFPIYRVLQAAKKSSSVFFLFYSIKNIFILERFSIHLKFQSSSCYFFACFVGSFLTVYFCFQLRSCLFDLRFRDGPQIRANSETHKNMICLAFFLFTEYFVSSPKWFSLFSSFLRK